MGFGDELLGAGMAKGAKAREKRIAFGDGKRIIWGPFAEQVFKGNPNVATPGSARDKDIEWIAHFPGNRAYNKLGNGKWIWNYDFSAPPGELYFTADEKELAKRHGRGFVLIEPNLPSKDVAVNKRWPVDRFQAVADALLDLGFNVSQFAPRGSAGMLLRGAIVIQSPDFRFAAAVLERSALYIGPEGGLHHAAAAVGTKAVVLFGGFIPPQVTGYDMHVNLFTGGMACGMKSPCQHCRDAMDAISVNDVLKPAFEILENVSRRPSVESA